MQADGLKRLVDLVGDGSVQHLTEELAKWLPVASSSSSSSLSSMKPKDITPTSLCELAVDKLYKIIKDKMLKQVMDSKVVVETTVTSKRVTEKVKEMLVAEEFDVSVEYTEKGAVFDVS